MENFRLEYDFAYSTILIYEKLNQNTLLDLDKAFDTVNHTLLLNQFYIKVHSVCLSII